MLRNYTRNGLLKQIENLEVLLAGAETHMDAMSYSYLISECETELNNRVEDDQVKITLSEVDKNRYTYILETLSCIERFNNGLFTITVIKEEGKEGQLYKAEISEFGRGDVEIILKNHREIRRVVDRMSDANKDVAIIRIQNHL